MSTLPATKFTLYGIFDSERSSSFFLFIGFVMFKMSFVDILSCLLYLFI